MHDGDELARSIVETVAERENVDVVDLERPLHEAVDVEALASLLATTHSSASVTFTYCGYSIRVDGGGGVRVSNPRSDAKPTTASA